MIKFCSSFRRQRGFTLLEIIVGLAISSMILVSLNLVMGAISRGMDQTAESLGRQSSLASALDVFSADIARIEPLRETPDARSPYLFEGSRDRMVYPLAERPGNNEAGLYLVRLTVRDTEDGTQLVRERQPFGVGASDFAVGDWLDEVVLASGDMNFAFAYRAPGAGLEGWLEAWGPTERMPEQIRITVTDRATGRLRIPVFVQPLRIDAEIRCAAPDAKGCGQRAEKTEQ